MSVTIAPWLHPTNFIEAMSAGAQAGLGARRADQESIEAGDRLRLAYDQLASSERREQEAAASKMQLAKASMALKSQQMQSIDRFREQEVEARKAQLDATQAYHSGVLQGQEASRALREQMAADKAKGKEYGAPEFFDIPGVPGAKGVYRKGSPGMHVVTPQRPPSTGGVDAQRIRAAAGLPKMIAQLADMDPASPEYAAGTNSVAMVQDFLKRTSPGVAAPKKSGGATHRFNANTGAIVPIGDASPAAADSGSAAAALLDHDETPVDDEEEP